MYEDIEDLKSKLATRFARTLSANAIEEIKYLLDLAHDRGYDCGRNETDVSSSAPITDDYDMHTDCIGRQHVCGDGI